MKTYVRVRPSRAVELVVERPFATRPDDGEDDEELEVAAATPIRELVRRLRDDHDVDEVGEELGSSPAFGLDLTVRRGGCRTSRGSGRWRLLPAVAPGRQGVGAAMLAT